MKNLKISLLDYLKLILVSIVIVLIYDKLSYGISHHIYTKSSKSVFLIEIPIILLVVSTLYFQRLKSKTLKYVFPVLPIISLYILFDLFYSFLLRSPSNSDFENLINIYDFYPIMFVGIILFVSSILFLILYLLIKARKYYSLKEYSMTIVVRIAILATLVIFLQTEVFKTYHKELYKYTFWSHKKTIMKNGKFSSFIFYSNLEEDNKKYLKADNNISISDTLYKEKISKKQNIHYIVLESFINPNYLKNTSYSVNPLSSELIKYLPDGDFSKVISPVYGGNTAQAEFELLTGVKALAKVNKSEFNILKGKQIDGFLFQFKKSNYDTVATIASNSGYFNSKSAYKSLGFDKVSFLEEEGGFIENENDGRIFDGDVFKHNLKFLKEYLENSKKPIFNYVLGLYGHLPYERNKQDRPDVINLESKKNDTVKRIANQFYYRTKALADYIDNILLIDPNSIILVSSDHLPPILSKKIKYKYSKHTNIAFLLNKGLPVEISKKRQYQVPWLIWDILSEKPIKRDNSKVVLEKLYYKALNEGIY